MQRLWGWALITVVFLNFAACSKSEKQSGAKTIGVSLLTRAHQFHKDLEEALLESAKQNNFKLIITVGEWDVGRQISQIEDFITLKL